LMGRFAFITDNLKTVIPGIAGNDSPRRRESKLSVRHSDSDYAARLR
jgi:hypothetical protein